MTPAIEQMYSEIGQTALDLAPDLSGKLLVYAEVEDGVASADVFYVDPSNVVRFRFGSDPLQDLIYSFWEAWKAEPGNREWRTMSYVLDNRKFTLDFAYPDQIDPNEELSDRRPRVLKTQFGDRKIDFSRPDG